MIAVYPPMGQQNFSRSDFETVSFAQIYVAVEMVKSPGDMRSMSFDHLSSAEMKSDAQKVASSMDSKVEYFQKLQLEIRTQQKLSWVQDLVVLLIFAASQSDLHYHAHPVQRICCKVINDCKWRSETLRRC